MNAKKIILILLLAVVSSKASAEWVAVGTGLNGNPIDYADLSTIHKNGDKVKIWSLSDLKTAAKIGDTSFMSMKVQSEYDCKVNQTRKLYLVVYSENMGKGKVVGMSETTSEWRPIFPGSPGETLLKIACGR